MNTGLRVALLVMAAALLAGAIWGAVQAMVPAALLCGSLAALCVVFERLIEAAG